MYIDSYNMSFPTATLFLDYLAEEGCLSDQALLLSVYPQTVGGRFVWGRKVQKKFSEYTPSDPQEGVKYVRRVLTPRLTPMSGNETGHKSVCIVIYLSFIEVFS